MGIDIVTRIALKAVRSYLNNTIGRFTPQDLQRAIDKKRDLWSVTPDGMRNQTRFFKGKFRNVLAANINNITTSLLIEWLRQDHPSLHTIILLSKENYIWFDHQVETIKKEIIKI